MGKRKRPESKFPFDSGLGLVFFRLCDAFTLVRIPSGVFHIIQKRHAVTGLFRPSKREKSPEFRAFFVPVSFLASKPGAPGGTRTPDLLVRSQTLYPAELTTHTLYVEGLCSQQRSYIISQRVGFVNSFFEKNEKISRFQLPEFILSMKARSFSVSSTHAGRNPLLAAFRADAIFDHAQQ